MARSLNLILIASFVGGVLVGLMLGVGTVSWASNVFGTGTLTGWSVTKDGEEVCSDPDVDTASKEIECD